MRQLGLYLNIHFDEMNNHMRNIDEKLNRCVTKDEFVNYFINLYISEGKIRKNYLIPLSQISLSKSAEFPLSKLSVSQTEESFDLNSSSFSIRSLSSIHSNDNFKNSDIFNSS